MPVTRIKRYTRADLRGNPHALHVFGDNLCQAGYGGQARECRGEPNAVGIPTKRQPSMDDSAFLTDSDLPIVRPIIQAAFRRLAAHLAAGGTVVLPADGVGTGLAQLHKRAPLIAAYIERCFTHLESFD